MLLCTRVASCCTRVVSCCTRVVACCVVLYLCCLVLSCVVSFCTRVVFCYLVLCRVVSCCCSCSFLEQILKLLHTVSKIDMYDLLYTVYGKIPVIVPSVISSPGYKPIKSETDFLSRLSAPPPDISPHIFIIIIIIFHSFHYEMGFFQFRQKQEKVKKTKVCNIFTFLITLMLF